MWCSLKESCSANKDYFFGNKSRKQEFDLLPGVCPSDPGVGYLSGQQWPELFRIQVL